MEDITGSTTAILRATLILGVWWNGFLVPVWDKLTDAWTYMNDLQEAKERKAGTVQLQTTEDVIGIQQKIAGIKRRYSELDCETLKLKVKYTTLLEDTQSNLKNKMSMLAESKNRYKKLKTYSLEDNESGFEATLEEITVAKGLKKSIGNLRNSQKYLKTMTDLLENTKSSSPFDMCNICCNSYGDKNKRTVITECGHVLCSDCIKHTKNKCPICRTNIEKKSIAIFV
jgi:hypothetical protein